MNLRPTKILMDSTEKKVVAIGLISLLAVVGSIAGTILYQQMQEPEVQLENLWAAKDFTLRNYNNESISFSDYASKVRLVTFVYLKCPDGCSLISVKLAQTFSRYFELGKAEDIAILTIDFDYVHDTSNELKEFAETISKIEHKNQQFLYGSEEEIKQVALDWKFFFSPINSTTHLNELNPDHDGGSHSALWVHQFIVYLVDKHGQVQKLFTGLEWDNSELYRYIDYLIEQ